MTIDDGIYIYRIDSGIAIINFKPFIEPFMIGSLDVPSDVIDRSTDWLALR